VPDAPKPRFRTIIHVDLDAFFCAVEEQRDPSLKGKAFAVGGSPDGRGVVASCSYAARAFGVRSAMSMATAIRMCPDLQVVSVRHGEYSLVSKKVMALLRTWTEQLQQISIDEAFLDVTPLASRERLGYDIARDIQDHVLRDLGLSCSIGVASNKLVAKIATDYGKVMVGKKHSPRAICVVPPGDEAIFLAPLPVSALWGVGPKTGQRLADMGIATIGDLASWPERDLMNRFGRHGYELSQHAKGIDKRDIVIERESKSVSSETTFIQDVEEWELLQTTLAEQAESVAKQLGKHHLQGATVKIKLRWSDFTTVTRQMTLPAPTAQGEVIEKAAIELLRQVWKDSRPIRLIGVGCANFSPIRQLSLWDAVEEEAPPIPMSVIDPTKEKKQERLKNALASIDAQYGGPKVRLGSEEFSADMKNNAQQGVKDAG
jgi:DNA polymerase-4